MNKYDLNEAHVKPTLQAVIELNLPADTSQNLKTITQYHEEHFKIKNSGNQAWQTWTQVLQSFFDQPRDYSQHYSLKKIAKSILEHQKNGQPWKHQSWNSYHQTFK